MQQQARAITLGVARFGAVLFALAVLSYLVVTAQRRAGATQDTGAEPRAASVAPAVASGSADATATTLPADGASATPGETEVFLFGSKSMPLESVEGVTPDVFLSTSKSAVLDISAGTTADAAAKPKPADATFLPSSKFKTLAPLPAKPADPAFLPSSKSLKLAPAPIPAAKPTTPARTID